MLHHSQNEWFWIAGILVVLAAMLFFTLRDIIRHIQNPARRLRGVVLVCLIWAALVAQLFIYPLYPSPLRAFMDTGAGDVASSLAGALIIWLVERFVERLKETDEMEQRGA